MGAYLNQPTALSHPLRPVVTHTRSHARKRLHTQRASTFTLTQGDTPSLLKIHNHHSLCKIHTHHVLSAWLHFINAHTLPHMHAQTPKRTSRRAPRLIASPFGWCHLFHAFCQWLTKSCSELVVF